MLKKPDELQQATDELQPPLLKFGSSFFFPASEKAENPLPKGNKFYWRANVSEIIGVITAIVLQRILLL